MIALFSYDEKPGMLFPQLTVRDFRTPTPEPYRGQPGQIMPTMSGQP
jgi:hypothetical protein